MIPRLVRRVIQKHVIILKPYRNDGNVASDQLNYCLLAPTRTEIRGKLSAEDLLVLYSYVLATSMHSCAPLPPGSRDYDAHLKHQGAILHELLPLCDDVALQGGATFLIHLRHGARERSAMHILPEKLLRCREA